MLFKDTPGECLYKVYGLTISSQISLYEFSLLCESSYKICDAVIIYGVVPKQISGGIIDNEYIKISRNECYFHIKGEAHYFVANGSKIVVEPETGCDEHNVRVYLLGTALGILLTQRNVIAMHGGTVVVDNKGVLITGQTGAGKSSLISAFREEGCVFLSDDVSALGKDKDSSIVVHPAYPQAKLCKDSMISFGYNPAKYLKTDSYRDKYIIPLEKSFWGYDIALSAIYELKVGDSNSAGVTEVSGIEKVRLILRNIYRIEIIRYLGLDPYYFKKCLDIACHIPMYIMERQKSGFTLKEQIKAIKSTLQT